MRDWNTFALPLVQLPIEALAGQRVALPTVERNFDIIFWRMDKSGQDIK